MIHLYHNYCVYLYKLMFCLEPDLAFTINPSTHSCVGDLFLSVLNGCADQVLINRTFDGVFDVRLVHKKVNKTGVHHSVYRLPPYVRKGDRKHKYSQQGHTKTSLCIHWL